MIWWQVIIAVLQLLLILLMIRYKVLTEKSIGNQFDTKLQEFRQKFEAELFRREREDKFKLACLDERLKAHQEAYAISLDMIRSVGSDNQEEIKKVKDSYWDLFRTRALYLSADARSALNAGFKSFDAYNHLNSSHNLGPNLQDKIQEHYEEIAGTPGKIMQAVDSETKPDQNVVLPQVIQDKSDNGEK
ncbi:MAG TPA: hypothetical protein VLX91_05820 [Candidatus Acidoferrales bacterium]|nr:hypothetical protein [Candidatus Acidoferrales bacterium]